MYSIVTSRSLLRRLGRFFRKHPELLDRFARMVEQLRDDPYRPHLRLHALSGELEGLHAVSLTHAYRVVLVLNVAENAIVLIDIGSHDAVYR
jgi:mRNA-degrading endonuclease YafQ of YafQ-DinJ toxin-antitoxin module